MTNFGVFIAVWLVLLLGVLVLFLFWYEKREQLREQAEWDTVIAGIEARVKATQVPYADLQVLAIPVDTLNEARLQRYCDGLRNDPVKGLK